MSKKTYTISELASEFDITTRAIRFYEEKGLIQPAREGRKRVYSTADRARLTLILRGKRIGMSLDESMEIIAMYDPDHGNRDQLKELLGRVQERQLSLQTQLEDIQATLESLNDVEQRCRKALGQHDQQGEL